MFSATTCANTTTEALSATLTRFSALFINESTQTIWLKINENAVANQGIRLNANGGSYYMSSSTGNLDTEAVDCIVGRVGTTKVGSRVIGFRAKTINTRKGERVVAKNLYWPVYAGETEERVLEAEADMGTGEGGVVHPLPLHAQPMAVGALNTRISNEVALLMADACVDNLDEGSAGAVIQGRTGAQPADPDTAVSGTNLFTLTCNTTAFGAAADAAPGGIATAAAITDDSSADATGTLGYCRASSSNAADTPLDDHIDGEAGTSGADFNFNTLAIVSGATVSMTSWTVTMPET